jgi:hypothetical protein
MNLSLAAASSLCDCSRMGVIRRAQKIGFVSQKRRRFLPLLLWRLSKAQTHAASVFVDEVNTRCLESTSYDV